jgi:hypothetical protein
MRSAGGGTPVLALSFGCNTPGYRSPDFGGFVTDERVVMNKDYRWTKRKLCTVIAHEIGHQTGDYGADHRSDKAIGRIPIPSPANGYPAWGWGICGDYNWSGNYLPDPDIP